MRPIHRGLVLQAQDLRDRYFGPTLVTMFQYRFPDGVALDQEALETMAATGVMPAGLLTREGQARYDATTKADALEVQRSEVEPAVAKLNAAKNREAALPVYWAEMDEALTNLRGIIARAVWALLPEASR